jgi:hypothetical protein
MRQFDGNFFAEKISVRPSGHSKQNALYFSSRMNGTRFAKTSNAAVD